MDEKYIYQEDNKFLVKNFVGSECVTFGSFDNVDEAIEFRDEMEDYGWPYAKSTSKSITKIESNIFEEDGIFQVSKQIAEFEIIFGRFDSLSQAQSFKYKLIENAWNLNFYIKPFKYGRYIRKGKNFIVYKEVDGKNITFGSYKYFDEAISRRDKLIEDNWGMDDSKILSNLGIVELDGLNHNIGKVGRKYVVFKWEGMKCILLALLPNLTLAVKFRDKLNLNKKFSSELGEYYFDTKYITTVGDLFRVSKVIDGRLETFGHYKTLDQAIEVRNFLMENNWDRSVLTGKRRQSIRVEKNRYIHKHNDGFTIFKRIDGELINFGFFDNIEDALEYRDFLEENNWVLNEDGENIEEKYDEYIYVKSDGKFYLMNEINGEMRIFGVFDDPFEAIAARLDCMRENWDLPSVPENRINDLVANNSSEIQIVDDFSDEEFLNEVIYESIKFPVTVGKSYKNKGWAVKRSYLVDLVPILPYEKACKVFLNGIEIVGKLNVHTRLFYSKNEELIDYLKKLYSIDPNTQTRIDFCLNHGIYQECPDISGKSLFFTTNFSKSLKNGLFAVPRSITKKILPILPYEEKCSFIINDIEVTGKFNLEFRFRFSNKSAIAQLESQIDDGEEIEVILVL